MTHAGGYAAVSYTTVLIMAGGTGGHVYPALCVAERLRRDGHRVIWLGTRRGLEAQVVPRAGIEMRYVHVGGLRGKGALSWLLAPVRLIGALWQSLSVIRRLWPGAVLGMGGFVSGPGGLAAWLLRRPLLIHEQNAVPGLTNRLLVRLANGVMEAFPGSFPERYRARHTGNPVRGAILELSEPEVRLGDRRGPLRLLVLGGSQGARVLNEVVPMAVATVAESTAVDVRHQAGSHDLEATRVRYAQTKAAVQLFPFIEDMAEAYAWADLVVCRAGAMTVSELTAAGLGSILVPFPYAVDDHQTRNARYLSDAGAALLVPQRDLSASSLGRLILDLHTARDRVLAMARKARDLALADATERVATLCEEVARA